MIYFAHGKLESQAAYPLFRRGFTIQAVKTDISMVCDTSGCKAYIRENIYGKAAE